MYRVVYLALLLVAVTQAQINITVEQATYQFNETDGDVSVCVSFAPSPSDNNYAINYSVSTIPGLPAATLDADYSISGDMIEILINQTNSFCIDISIMTDDVIELNEAFMLTLKGGDNVLILDNSNITVTIIDDDGDVNITVPDSIIVMEGDTVTLCANTTDMYDFTFDVTLSITNDTADASDVTLTNDTLQFTNGSTSACYDVTIDDSDDPEPQQRLNIAYSLTDQPSNVILTSTMTTVVIASQLVISARNLSQDITENGGYIEVCATLNGPSDGSVTAAYTVTSGTAMMDEDYIATNGILTFGIGSMEACLNITIINDNIFENNEEFTVSFSDGNGATISSTNSTTVINIIDDDDATIGFGNIIVNIMEGPRSYLSDLFISREIAIIFNISGSTNNGTAIAGDDFNAIVDEVFQWSSTSDPVISVPLIDDNIVEHNESFTVTITSQEGRISANQSTVTVTIVDDDISTISVAESRSLTESETTSICLTPSNQIAPLIGEVSSEYMVSYTVGGSADQGDFTLSPPSPLIINSLSTNPVCVTVTLVDDTSVESEETIILTWSLDSALPTGVQLDTPDTTITIVDNDVSTSTMIPTPTAMTTPTTASPPSTALLDTYTIIGIIVGIVVAGLLCLLLLCCIVVCFKIRLNRQGFYPTQEDKGDAPQMLRYSASLRSISSQTVLPMDTREKENEYMV